MRSVEHCQVDQHTHFGSYKEENKKKGAEGRFEEIIAENFPNLVRQIYRFKKHRESLTGKTQRNPH